MMRLRTIWLAFIGILSAICIAGSIWADNTVFIQATDSTVRRIARELQYQAKAQIEVEAGKDRKVSLNLTDVSLEAALDALTAAAGLTWERRGERYVITLQPEVIRLITYNIFDGGRQGVRPFARLELLAEVIGTAEPDAVMLQEADGWDADGYAASQEFARLTGLQRFFVAPGNSGRDGAVQSPEDDGCRQPLGGGLPALLPRGSRHHETGHAACPADDPTGCRSRREATGRGH